MRELMFAVDGLQLKKKGDFGGIRAGSRQYLRCSFETGGDEWLRAKKIAVFNEEYPVPLNANGECMVPDEVTDGRSFKVYLAGQNGRTRMLTNAVLIEQVV